MNDKEQAAYNKLLMDMKCLDKLTVEGKVKVLQALFNKQQTLIQMSQEPKLERVL